jgi:hypothetical protein
MHQRERDKINILPLGQVMSIDSPMLSSIYSCIEEPLRKTPSKYRL